MAPDMAHLGPLVLVARKVPKPNKPFVMNLVNPQTKTLQLLAVDHSARASMKNAASCEN